MSRKRCNNLTSSKLYFILLVVLAIALSFPLPARSQNLQLSNIHGNQLVLITHGWDTGVNSKPAWVDSMRDAIARNFLDDERNYANIEIVKSGSKLVASCSFTDDSLTTGKTGTILATLNWSAVANHLVSGVSSQMVAAAVVKLLTESQSGHHPMAELPIHLIGHSRGGGLICELARLLGEQGVVVDQITPLDPHPLTTDDIQSPLRNVIDTPITIYENTVFTDCYFQDSAYPEGEPISGAYNRHFPALPGGYFDNLQPFADHRNVHLLYQGTIDLNNPVNNNEAEMSTEERSAWFNAYENSGDHTGFCYSRIKNNGDRSSHETPVTGENQIQQGLHLSLGGSGTRHALSWGNANWPNLATFKINLSSFTANANTYSTPIGTAIQLNYTALDYNDTYNVTIFADQDRNPYNNNNLKTITQVPGNTATRNSFRQHSFIWDTTDMTDGDQVYLYAEISDSKHVRYLYADESLLFTNAKYNYYLPYFKSGDGYWSGLAVTNLDSENSTPFTITLYGTNGELLTTMYPEPLPPAGQTALAMAQTSPDEGWIKVSSSNPLSGLSFLGNNNMVDIPFSENLFTHLVIPHVTQTADWDTVLYACNPNPTTANLNFTFTDQDGTMTLNHSVALPANGSGSYPLAIVFPEQTSLSGSITITSDQGITAFALYSDIKSGGNYAAGINAVPLNQISIVN